MPENHDSTPNHYLQKTHLIFAQNAHTNMQIWNMHLADDGNACSKEQCLVIVQWITVSIDQATTV